MPQPRYAARSLANPPTTPFLSAEEAWFWFVRCQQVRREGARLDGSDGLARPCDPDDVYRAVTRLRRSGVIGDAHLRVLASYGLRGSPPDGRYREEANAERLWNAAIDRLSTILRGKGIVS